MTVKVTLPTSPQPYLGTGPLPADFYAYEELLSDSERERVGRVRDFFRTEAAPIVDDYWARAEFPFELIKGFAKLGLLDWADPDSPEPPPSNLVTGITALEMAHADPSLAAFFGVHTGLAMGTHPSLRLRRAEAAVAAGDEPLREDRRVRADRAARRLGRRRRHADHRAPRGRRVGAQRRQALDRQRHVRRPPVVWARDVETTRSRASSWRRPPPGSPRRRSRTSSRCGSCRTPTSCSTTAGCPRRTGCRTRTRSGTPPRCCA